MGKTLDEVFAGLSAEESNACATMVHVLVNTLNVTPTDEKAYNIKHAESLADKSQETLIAILGEASVNALIEGVLREEEDAMLGVNLLIGENIQSGKYSNLIEENGEDGVDIAIAAAREDFMNAFYGLIDQVKQSVDLESEEHEKNKNNLKIVIGTILRYSLAAGVLRAGEGDA